MTHAASTASPALVAEHTVRRPPPWASLGIIFGLLSAAAIALWGPIGVSGTYPRFVGSLSRRVAPDFAAANPYLVKMGTLVTPETMLVLGLLVGGFLADSQALKADALDFVGDGAISFLGLLAIGWRAIWRATICATLKTPVRLMSIMRCHASGSISRK